MVNNCIKKNKISILIIVSLILALFLSLGRVYADSIPGEDLNGDGFDELSSYEYIKGIFSVADDSWDSALIEKEISGAESWAKAITEGSFSDGAAIIAGSGGPAYASAVHDAIINYDTKGGSLASLYVILKTLGAFWCIAIGIVHLMESINKGIDPVQAVYQLLIELAISLLFISYAGKILDTVTDLGKVVLSSFAQGIEETKSALSYEDLLDAVSGSSRWRESEEKGGCLWAIKVHAILMFPYVMSLLVGIASKLIAISILLELAIRKLLAPLAVADVYQEGLNSPGVVYFKKYFATYLKGAISIIVCFLIKKLMGALPAPAGGFGSMLGYVFSILAIQFAGIMTMFVGGKTANDIVGV